MARSDIALGIMCKAPLEGACKTRLCPTVTPQEAAALSRGFIADVAAVVAEVAASASACGVAVHTPPGDRTAFEGLLPDGFPMLEQRGAELGERLLHATQDLLGRGFAGVCLLNSDSPTLPASLLRQTIDELRRPDDRIVLGPAIDGGYYLIGLKCAHPALFRGVTWGSSHVLAQTLSRAAGLQVPITVLPVWYDVDDLASLQLLMHELFGTGVPLATDGLVGSPAAELGYACADCCSRMRPAAWDFRPRRGLRTATGPRTGAAIGLISERSSSPLFRGSGSFRTSICFSRCRWRSR